MTTQPSPHGLAGWRALLRAEPDRDARRELVASWATALDAHTVADPGRDPVWHLPHDVDQDTAGVLWCHATTNGVPMRMSAENGHRSR